MNLNAANLLLEINLIHHFQILTHNQRTMKRKRYNKLNPMIKGLCFVLFLTFQWPWNAGAQDNNPDQMVGAGQEAGEYNSNSYDCVSIRQLNLTINVNYLR